jgi:Skp family chaperone for outer membrane proteins
MNTATILYIKGEFQSLLDSMKTFCEQPHAVEPQTLEQIKAFYSKLLCINSPLENERRNHQAFGELDKIELMFANESEQNAWYQRREKLEKMMDRMIEHSSLLILLCQIIQFDPSQKTFDLVLQLLREIISFIQKELASLESENSHLNNSIKDFQRLEASLNKFFCQLDHLQGEQAVKFIDELKSKVECYQLLTQEQSQKFATQEAEVKQQEELELKHQQPEKIKQKITNLKRQHQQQLQNREAKLLDKINQLQKQITDLERQHQQQLQNREAKLLDKINELQKQITDLERQHQQQLQNREAKLLDKINQLQKQITDLKRQHQEKLQNREAELLDKINQLQKQITDLKRQHQQQLQNREAELSVKYQEKLQNREAELSDKINQLQKQITQLKSQQTENYQERAAQLVTQINQLQQQIAEVQRQHQEQTCQGQAEYTLKINQLQQHIAEFKTQEAENIKQREAELKSQNQQKLEQYESQLKLQHQEQLQNREAELKSQYQEQLNNYESQLKLQHQEQLQNRESELSDKVNQLQQHIAELKIQEAENIKQREAELSLQHQEQLNNYESQLKLQHQEQLQQREAELHSQYQEQLQQRESELRQEEKERIKKQINELESQIKEREIKANIEAQNNDKKPDSIKQTFTLPLVLILLVPLLGIVGFSAQNTFKRKPEQNTVNIVEKVTGENNIKSAEQLALEAGDMIKNSPHPLTVWQTAQNKWQKSIQLLEAVSNDTANSEQIQKQLEIYRTDYNSVTQKIAQEQKAVNNLEAAQKLALEASVIVQKPPYPLTVWQTAQDKWQKAVNLLESIPEDAFIAAEAQEKLDIYRTNLEIIRQRVKIESL